MENKNIKQDKHTCFFCSKEIDSHKSLEHIIPNALLGKLGIKEDFLDGKNCYQYSRIKVPAHKKCNSEFGSRYEEEIIKLLDDQDNLYEQITKEETNILTSYTPNQNITSIITTWLLKIYYGLFYNDYIKTDNENYKVLCKEIIDCENFKLVQESYKKNYGFFLPSSLFLFKSNTNNFDLRTIISPQTILIKINKLIFILCIGDGYLLKHYITKSNLEKFRQLLLKIEKENEGYPIHYNALAEIVAINKCIPKAPSFIFSKQKMINMSFATLSKNPNALYAIDYDLQDQKILSFLRLLPIQASHGYLSSCMKACSRH